MNETQHKTIQDMTRDTFDPALVLQALEEDSVDPAYTAFLLCETCHCLVAARELVGLINAMLAGLKAECERGK